MSGPTHRGITAKLILTRAHPQRAHASTQERPTVHTDKIEDVMSELLGEGYRIVWEDGSLSPAIDWVDWIEDPEDEDKEKVEVTFQDGSTLITDKGVPMRQIWHEDVD